ncbi:MAG TPA: hypothetical protein GXX19_00580 [Syntrophomonadaceae bacterium]|nr:hypothetical protein [Syntrophomonadaceae bacterium]
MKIIKSNKSIIIILCLLLLFLFETYAYAVTYWQPQPKPYIYSRSAWGARSPSSSMSSRGTGYYLIFHHTARSFTSTDKSACAAEIREIQNIHMDENKWSDIGYHYIIDPAGRIWQGRLDQYIGAHTLSYNNNIGIANLGDFEGFFGIGANTPTTASYNAMCSLSKWLAYRDNLDLPIAYCHKDFNDTACPGRNMEYYIWDSLRGHLYLNMVER